MQLLILVLLALLSQHGWLAVAENTTVAAGEQLVLHSLMCVHQLQQSSLSICCWGMVAGLNLTGPSPNAGLQAIEGNLSTALPGLAVLQDRATGDCAEPSRVNLQKELAMRADLVITGQLRKPTQDGKACRSCSGLIAAVPTTSVKESSVL